MSIVDDTWPPMTDDEIRTLGFEPTPDGWRPITAARDADTPGLVIRKPTETVVAPMLNSEQTVIRREYDPQQGMNLVAGERVGHSDKEAASEPEAQPPAAAPRGALGTRPSPRPKREPREKRQTR